MAEIHDSRYGPISVKRHFRAKYVRLSVAPGGSLSISAPLYTPLHFIRRFIASSSQEIDNLLTYNQTVYHDGGQIGKSHALKVIPASLTSVNYKKPCITVSLAPNDVLESYSLQQLIKPLVAKALRNEAKAYLPRRLAYLAKNAGFSYNKTYLSHAKSRWGSCSSDHTISLNIALMKLDFPLIDYVIVHELAHTVELNHSAKFWRLVEQNDPDFKQHRTELKQQSPHI
jgi:predicted metal-dependent hydrolase